MAEEERKKEEEANRILATESSQVKRTVVSSSSSSKKSDSDDSIRTSENYEDSEDEANPLNQLEKQKTVRGVKFADTLASGDEPGYHSGPASQSTLKRSSPTSQSSSMRSGGKKVLKKTETKVFNFREDIQQMKETMNVEQIWLDFGKQHTKV